MVKQPAMESSEFTMSHEDFPALPGAPPAGSGGGQQQLDQQQQQHQQQHSLGSALDSLGNQGILHQV